MDTRELEKNLRELDIVVLNLGQSIQSMKNSIAQYYSQVDSLESRAQAMMYMASNEENELVSSQMYSQATACMNQAYAYRRQAEGLESQIGEMSSELNGYKSEYQRYMEEGQTNLANLKIAADKLMKVDENKYGVQKTKEALNAIKQRIVYNQNLVNVCHKRIRWIEEICGPSDDSYVMIKVKRR